MTEEQRQRIIEELPDAFAALRDDPDAWQAEIEDRRFWDASLGDGQEGE